MVGERPPERVPRSVGIGCRSSIWSSAVKEKPMKNTRRLWAAAAVVLAVTAVAVATALAIVRFPDGVSFLTCLTVAGFAGGYSLSWRGARRLLATLIWAAAVAGAAAVVVLEGRPLLDLSIVAAVVGAWAASREAFAVHARLPPAPRPRRPVLFYNPWSGGGTADRLHLAEEARRRDIEPVRLHPHDDVESIVRDAVLDGVDALAMAGGDGSQAIVAKIASENGLPYACVPAGTRNHFALDLGVDRDDVVGALDAIVSGGERLVDLGEVNGLVFVNNVSLGVCADAVQHLHHREAKIRAPIGSVPDAADPRPESPGIGWQNRGHHEAELVVVVSNNGYRLGGGIASGTRPRLDAGALGVTIVSATGREARVKPLGHTAALDQWATPRFTIDADQPVRAGIDGEAVELEPPLRFQINRRALRVRVARDHPGASPSAYLPSSPLGLVNGLVKLALRGRSD